MTNFLIINEETKEFVNIDSIDSVEAYDSALHMGGGHYSKSRLNVSGEKIDSPFLPHDMRTYHLECCGENRNPLEQ